MQHVRIPTSPPDSDHDFLDMDTDLDYINLDILARTYRLFSNPALEVIWRTRWSLGPLLLCLPKDNLEYDVEERHHNGKYTRYRVVSWNKVTVPDHSGIYSPRFCELYQVSSNGKSPRNTPDDSVIVHNTIHCMKTKSRSCSKWVRRSCFYPLFVFSNLGVALAVIPWAWCVIREPKCNSSQLCSWMIFSVSTSVSLWHVVLISRTTERSSSHCLTPLPLSVLVYSLQRCFRVGRHSEP